MLMEQRLAGHAGAGHNDTTLACHVCRGAGRHNTCVSCVLWCRALESGSHQRKMDLEQIQPHQAKGLFATIRRRKQQGAAPWLQLSTFPCRDRRGRPSPTAKASSIQSKDDESEFRFLQFSLRLGDSPPSADLFDSVNPDETLTPSDCLRRRTRTSTYFLFLLLQCTL